jgi:DNA mismatch repair protein MutL
VINQIAAGEVVERPASVVKELVENSLDAGAGQITVEIEGGGKSLVRVIDDGAGMSRASIHLALQRHATSKLRSTGDLFALSSFGFRGEALPSIAAVSRVAITSRDRGGGPAAWRVELEGGRVVDEREVGAPPGTQIEVRDLLFNVPARLKFMKADSTESAHIADWVNRLAVANPGVRFRLRHRRGKSSRVGLDAAAGSRDERVAAIFGDALLNAEGAGGGVSVVAYVSPPELAASGSRRLQVFVGRRPVRDRGLTHAIMSSYGDRLESGRYPTAAVFVEVDRAEVDVNVHPQKLEVRFADPQAVYAVVAGTVARALAAVPPRPPERVDPRPIAARRDLRNKPLVASRAAERLADYAASRRRFAPARRELRSAPPRVPVAAAPESPATARFIGQLDRSVLLCEIDGDLILVDQHGASERLELARLRARLRAGSLPAQRLMFPETFAVTAAAAAAIEVTGDRLAELGFVVERTGELAAAVHAVPAGLRDDSGPAIAARLVDELAAGGEPRITDTALVAIACNRAARAGDAVSAARAAEILDALTIGVEPPVGPHGRALFVRLSGDDIDRRFVPG